MFLVHHSYPQRLFTMIIILLPGICEGTGTSAPTAECDPGWYCELGSWIAQANSSKGGYCIAGEYRPQGSLAQKSVTRAIIATEI